MMDASVVLLTRKSRSEFLWVKRPHHHAFLGGYWALIGGGVNDVDQQHHDPSRACAARELEEEFGLALDVDQLTPFGTWHTPPLFSVQFRSSFFVADLEHELDDPVATMNDEAIDAEWISPDSALEKIRDGRRPVSPPIRLLVEQLCANAHEIFLERNDETLRLSVYEVSRGVHVFPLKTKTLPPATTTNCIFVGENDFVIVDPGTDAPDQLDYISNWVSTRSETGKPLGIFLTHHHPDHVLGAPELANRLGLPIWAHPKFEAKGVTVDQRFEEGDHLPGLPDVQVWFTPGHASDHCCLFVESTGTVIGGDLIASFGTILVNPPDGNMAQYLESLRRVRDAKPRLLVPAHGWIVPEPEHRLTFYISHRLAREEKIFTALQAVGTGDEHALLPLAYADVPTEAWPLAALSVRAHLEHLIEQERVRRVDDLFEVI